MTSIDEILAAAVAQIETSTVQRMDEAIARAEQRLLAERYLPLGPWMDLKEAAAYAKMSESALREKVARKEIAHGRHGVKLVFCPLYLDTYLTSATTAQEPAATPAPTPMRGRRRAA